MIRRDVISTRTETERSGQWGERREERGERREERRRRCTHPIDDEQLAADVLARGAREEDDGAGKVARLAPAPGGDALRDLAQAHRVCEQLLVPADGWACWCVGVLSCDGSEERCVLCVARRGGRGGVRVRVGRAAQGRKRKFRSAFVDRADAEGRTEQSKEA